MSCTKQSGECARLGGPQYVGSTSRQAKERFGEHIGSAVQQCQVDTEKPVGHHVRLPGHSVSDMKFLPIERVQSRDKFVLEARESYWIQKYKTLKVSTVHQLEHGLNLVPYGLHPTYANCI